MKLPRIMLAAPSSGSGKTLITCGILQALKNRGLRLSAFKCGPDYIDPMFHGRILGISSKNLDTFFTEDAMTRRLFAKEAKHSEFSVLEGVMGYYDGLAGISVRASAYDVARVTKTPVILIVNTKGMSTSVCALIQGFLQFQTDSRIAGVILNNCSAALYPRLKEQIEAMLPIRVLGYVPNVPQYVIESRHLGLVTPAEVENLQEKIEGLSMILETSIDLDALLEIGNGAEAFEAVEQDFPAAHFEGLRIAVAKDEAFCFFYRDNLELLEELGAQLVSFSPIHDRTLPENVHGMLLYGGYPELYAKQLSRNTSMLQSIRRAMRSGMPYLAECGGFLYLHEWMEDMNQTAYPMLGRIKGTAFQTDSLERFGYITLEAQKDTVFGDAQMCVQGHEFHYFDSTNNGTDFIARKPLSNRSWACMHADDHSAAGFAHLYYPSCPKLAVNFLKTCEVWRDRNEN